MVDTLDKKELGLYSKFIVERADGQSKPGQKHDRCKYFVLDVTHDPFAVNAIRAYAEACKDDYPALSRDLRTLIGDFRALKVPSA